MIAKSIARRLGIGIAATTLSLAVPAVAGPDMAKLDESVFNIYVYGTDEHGQTMIASGSGFLVSREGYIVTNNHVVRGAKLIKVFLPGENVPPILTDDDAEQFVKIFKGAHDATVVTTDAHRDLALIKTDALPNPPLTIARTEPKQGDRVYALGYPALAQRTFATTIAVPTMTSGAVGRVYATQNDGSIVHVIQHEAGINHGNSGGPLIDECSRVVGVNTWGAVSRGTAYSNGVVDVDVAQSLNYSTSTAELIALLGDSNVKVSIDDQICDGVPNFRSILQNPAYLPFFIAGGLLLLAIVALLLFRRPRKYVAERASRSVEALSRKVRPDDSSRDAAAPRNITWVRFRASPGQEEHSCKVAGSTLAQSSDGLIVGRTESDADMVIAQKEVSRKHARLRSTNGRLTIEDLGSTNGTKVNGTPLSPNKPIVVRDGDKVAFGPVQFVIRIE